MMQAETMQKKQPLLSVEKVETYYGNICALKGIDMTVDEGEIVALIGANGAGKSTLMMTIFGSPRAHRSHSLQWQGHYLHAAARDCEATYCAVAGRPSHLPAHDGSGKPPDGREPR
ncbi:Branched-chain amino acid transport ATP-binding protein LivF [Brucella suis bv. 2]|nr:Branched-chain amino acid transport ATP-binding protein LivF [Brucella suis bv. 2]AIB23283.1 Branched-chain amino acid transport ATP-binding protein LivF [Brucella suis bv. 2]AIB26640.1 Branched-chain amino acid transport ATP-binding protein LivF [Brucella suis bv. 2]AIB30038.1 Branched-chain amino acid transport ATP-binding protein LivF [Brucella suis bv. 2]AIB33408.1 Branched-chain amino acid transport ATP-binding protein LivF [Brucella suis bv. 2]